MNIKIKNINQAIANGKLLEENIPQLFNHLSNDYQTYALVQLAMHYYAFYEAYCDNEDTWSDNAKEVTSKLNTIIKENIIVNQSGLDREGMLIIVDKIRNDVMKRMNLLTSYTDIFQIYEYVLNRLEYRFHKESDSIDDGEFSKEILRYIFDTEDNLVINEKIKEIIGQLPIRITKQKYYDLLKDSVFAYLGNDRSSLETYLYMIRTSAMLYHEEGMDTYYPKLWEQKEFFSHLKYKDITIEDFNEATKVLEVATLTLETETTVYFGLQEMINEIYALLLCQPYAGMVIAQTQAADIAALEVISEINHLFIMNKKIEPSLDLMKKFTDMEGVQEDISYEIAILEDALYEVSKNQSAFTESLMLGQVLQVLLRSKSLLSSSLFIDLVEEIKEEQVVDEDMVEKEAKALLDELALLFAEQDKVISRAVIANTINKMPVFFQNHKEVMDYVCYAFQRCSDPYEKTACVEIIRAIMAQ